MKFLHLSDLHIGKRIHDYSMLEDQKYILQQILCVADSEKAVGVFICGDIYDKSVPPAEAVLVFDEFLTELANRNIPTFIISGNHDSAQRVSFGATLMQKSGIYVSPVFDGKLMSVDLGDVCIWLLPFVKPSAVRAAYSEEEDIVDYNSAIKAVLRHNPIDASKKNIILAHQFIVGASRCESEELSVGGLDQVDSSVFDDYIYVALGHIHGPQSIGRDAVRYCGTPLKYSFSEVEHQKSVTVVTVEDDVKIDTVALKPLRDMKKIKGSFDELMKATGVVSEDYVQIILTDEDDIPNAVGRLRNLYPNFMLLDYDNRRTRAHAQISAAGNAIRRSPYDLFCEFYKLQNGSELSDVQAQFVKDTLESLEEDHA